MINNIKISIITPTYNRENFLDQTIESILSQDFKDFEYIIIDDGSTDNTKKIIEPYLKDTRVRYIHKENSGEAETVNLGWKLAVGEYFTQVNSDDPVLPNFLSEMVKVMDKNKDKILAYPNFNIIDEKNNIISSTKSPDWDFKYALKNFSCYAASPGVFIRRSSFHSWKKIKQSRFKYINDIEMYWDMALVGDFLHVPKILTTWREHKSQISVERYKSIHEIEAWFKYYFNKKDIANEILALKPDVRKSILYHFISLIEDAKLNISDKRIMSYQYKKELGIPVYEFDCIQIGNNDLIGNKFNGHNLHLYLREKSIDAKHLVVKKESNDETTFLCNSRNADFTESVIKNKLFIESEIVHMHIIHDTPFDLYYLPLITKLKPTIITLHDPFFLGGHCVYHFDCEKWKTHCYDCEHLDKPFAIENDDTALRFEIKKQAIQNSNIVAIVASKWMEDKVKESPIWVGKKIYRVPFGIDHDLFKPKDIKEAKKELKIDENSITLMFRSQLSQYKGIDIIKNALKNIKSENKITLITVAEKNLLNEFKDKFDIIEYDWIKDDNLMVKLYQASDIFLMPSRQEAFGMMAIEAMSCQKVVLALDCEGSALKDVINSPECGLAVKEEEYTKTLQCLIDNSQEREIRGQKSLVYAQKNYNKDIYVNKIIDIYKETIESHKTDKDADLILEQLVKYKDTYFNTDMISNQTVRKKVFDIKIFQIEHDNRFVIFTFLHFIKLSIKINDIAWWIPVRKWRDSFRNKFIKN